MGQFLAEDTYIFTRPAGMQEPKCTLSQNGYGVKDKRKMRSEQILEQRPAVRTPPAREPCASTPAAHVHVGSSQGQAPASDTDVG